MLSLYPISSAIPSYFFHTMLIVLIKIFSPSDVFFLCLLLISDFFVLFLVSALHQLILLTKLCFLFLNLKSVILSEVIKK